MSTTAFDRLMQLHAATEVPDFDSAVIEAACIELLPDMESLTFGEQAWLLCVLAEIIGDDPARQDAAAELAEEAWLLAREDDEIVLAVEAKCAHIRFTAHKHTTFEGYLQGLNAFDFMREHSHLPNDQLNVIEEAHNRAYAHGSSLVEQGVLR